MGGWFVDNRVMISVRLFLLGVPVEQNNQQDHGCQQGN
jgi:hypothetical protein